MSSEDYNNTLSCFLFIAKLMTYHTSFAVALLLDKQKQQANSPESAPSSSSLLNHPKFKRVSL